MVLSSGFVVWNSSRLAKRGSGRPLRLPWSRVAALPRSEGLPSLR
jgi:hypothetical protein